MDYIGGTEKIPDEIIGKVEYDLRCYPDWIVRIEAGGLGIPSRCPKDGSSTPNLSSLVEYDVELSDEIKSKILIIEKVYDKLYGTTKDLVNLRYFRDYSRKEVLDTLNITKKSYYRYRDKAFTHFARAMGYID